MVLTSVSLHQESSHGSRRCDHPAGEWCFCHGLLARLRQGLSEPDLLRGRAVLASGRNRYLPVGDSGVWYLGIHELLRRSGEALYLPVPYSRRPAFLHRCISHRESGVLPARTVKWERLRGLRINTEPSVATSGGAFPSGGLIDVLPRARGRERAASVRRIFRMACGFARPGQCACKRSLKPMMSPRAPISAAWRFCRLILSHAVGRVPRLFLLVLIVCGTVTVGRGPGYAADEGISFREFLAETP